MQLSDSDLGAYLRLVRPTLSSEKQHERAEAMRAKVVAGERDLADLRVVRGSDGELTAAMRLAPAGEGVVVVVGPFGDATEAATLLPEAFARAQELNTRVLMTRPTADRLVPAYRSALLDLGFVERGERIEFKTSVEALPLDDGSPLTWKGLSDVGEDFAVTMLARAAEGDPHGLSEDEDPRDALRSYLSDAELTCDPDCVQIGYDGDDAVAFLCAQIAPSDGWSRITYMGLVPAARGRGLGIWVHRRGFRLMRDLGGKLYHGGTASSNAAMVRLFTKHGCEEIERMIDFEWNA